MCGVLQIVKGPRRDRLASTISLLAPEYLYTMIYAHEALLLLEDLEVQRSNLIENYTTRIHMILRSACRSDSRTFATLAAPHPHYLDSPALNFRQCQYMKGRPWSG